MRRGFIASDLLSVRFGVIPYPSNSLLNCHYFIFKPLHQTGHSTFQEFKGIHRSLSQDK